VKISEVRTSRINPSGKKLTAFFILHRKVKQKNAEQSQPVSIDKAEYARRGIINSDTVKIEL